MTDVNSADIDRRSRLLSIKLRSLVREHLGLASDPDGTNESFALGAGFLAADATWVLIDGEASRALGPVLAWTSQFERHANLLVENNAGLLARRASLFDADITVWHVDDHTITRAIAEPHIVSASASDAHLSFVDIIEASGADALIEHGVVVGEVRGLEMCRVVDDATTGDVHLEVGMGRHDREAFTMIHGELPTAQAMRQVIDAVLPHRTEGADSHPFNQFGVERLSRWKAIKDPSTIGFSTLAPADPPVLRTNVKDSVPCVAIGLTGAKRLSTAVFVHGVDLDCVSFAVDAASRLGTQDVTIAVRRRDVIASIERLANMASIQVRLAYLS
jgi:hypothetical protein